MCIERPLAPQMSRSIHKEQHIHEGDLLHYVQTDTFSKATCGGLRRILL